MAAAQMHVTVAGGSITAPYDTWAKAMDMATFITEIEGNAEAGDVYYVKEGTYTMGETVDMSTRDGTVVSPIKMIGVKAGTTNEGSSIVVGDHATDTARPLFAMEANAFTMATYWKMYNIRFTGSENQGVTLDDWTFIFNCKSSHSGTFNLQLNAANCVAIACEATGATNGSQLNSNSSLLCCYIHDVTNGATFQGTNVGIHHCIIDTCSGKGIDINTRSGARIINNTIYNCGIGIYGTTANNCLIVNNILDANTVGIEWTTQSWGNFIDFNSWDNTDDIQDTDVEIGFYAVTGDPGMNGPAGGDFAVGTGDNVHDAGLDAGQFTGATV